MALLVGIATLGLGVPAGAAPTAPAAPAAPQDVGAASCFSPGPHGFSDVPTNHWANTAIAWLVEANITSGTEPGKFSPNTSVTRAQMAIFLWRNADSPQPAGSHNFSDVPTNHWANTAITWLVEAGITSGTSPGKFSPNAKVTRAQMAVFLWTNAGKPAPTGPHGFSDVPANHWAKTAIAWLVEAGITSGTSPGKYSPNNPVTRAQMAIFLHSNACTPPNISVAAGTSHTCALTIDGTVNCWGKNDRGQLGDGTTTRRNSPTPVTGLNGVTAIAAGDRYTCALITNRNVKCWGLNYNGELGDGTTNQRNTPVTVSGLTNATTITTGDRHTCVRTTNGTAKCWGYNWNGGVGDGTSIDRTTPTTVTGLNGVTAIAAGSAHTCAVITNGTAKCWGYNSSGENGDGSLDQSHTPRSVLGLNNAATITAGGAYTCAVTTDGRAKCWGNNGHGRLGDGTTTNRRTPTPVTGLTNASNITAGDNHTCAVATNGSTKCWGYNYNGQLGDGTTNQRNTPTSVSGLSNATTTITAGQFHTCALTTYGTIRCWGNNGQGQLGDGTFTDRHTPTPATGL